MFIQVKEEKWGNSYCGGLGEQKSFPRGREVLFWLRALKYQPDATVVEGCHPKYTLPPASSNAREQQFMR